MTGAAGGRNTPAGEWNRCAAGDAVSGVSMEQVRTFTASDGMEITIRPARGGDSCGILGTVRSNSIERSYILMEQYGKSAEAEAAYIDGLDRTKNLLAVATAGGEVVGCLAALQADRGTRPETEHILHVGLHLREPFRGRGIGSAMLAYAVDWAADAGYRKLEASIFTANQRSLHLFTKAGFTREGVRQNRIRVGAEFIDEVLMGRVLPARAAKAAGARPRKRAGAGGPATASGGRRVRS